MLSTQWDLQFIPKDFTLAADPLMDQSNQQMISSKANSTTDQTVPHTQEATDPTLEIKIQESNANSLSTQKTFLLNHPNLHIKPNASGIFNPLKSDQMTLRAISCFSSRKTSLKKIFITNLLTVKVHKVAEQLQKIVQLKLTKIS